MEDCASCRAFVKFAEVGCLRCGGNRDNWGVAEHPPDIGGNLYPDPGKSPHALVLELLRASCVLVKEGEGFHLGKYGQKESSDFEIDQAASYHPNLADFVAVAQAAGRKGRAGRSPFRTDYGSLEHCFWPAGLR